LSRAPGQRAGTRHQEVRKFETYYQTLVDPVGWLLAEGVAHMSMEASGIYWVRSPTSTDPASVVAGSRSATSTLCL
jgi:hypothetical protein